MKFFASLSVKPACFNKSFIKPFLFSSCENEFSFRLLVDRKSWNEKSLSFEFCAV